MFAVALYCEDDEVHYHGIFVTHEDASNWLVSDTENIGYLMAEIIEIKEVSLIDRCR